jgi:hypothetical protein
MRPRIASMLGALALAMAGMAAAYETDQYSYRLTPLRDSAPVLNREVNSAIADIVEHWQGPRDDGRLVMDVFHRIGGYFWVDHLERWAMNSSEVEKLPTPRRQSMYRGLPLRATRVAALFGIGPTFRIGGALVGSDKIGHFLSQGRKFWQRWQRNGDEQRAANIAARIEAGIFGGVTTGAYSNSDLVANYEGYRFYRSLFEDDIVAGKPAILTWQNGRWQVQRLFDWNDHVNDYWDEALNPNAYSRSLRSALKSRLGEFCDDYTLAPERYRLDPGQDDLLAGRYHMLGLRPDPALRLDAVCAQATAVAAPID